MIGFVRDLVRVLRMPCREHTTLFTRQLDEPLPRGVAAGLAVHVLYCKGCRKFRAQIRKLRDASRELARDIHAGEGLPKAVRDRIVGRATGATKKNDNLTQG